jgi:solute carrier family 35, member E1
MIVLSQSIVVCFVVATLCGSVCSLNVKNGLKPFSWTTSSCCRHTSIPVVSVFGRHHQQGLKRKRLPSFHSSLKLSAENPESCAPTLVSPAPTTSKATLTTSINLILWYLISSYYNIYNKKALTALKLPWTVATIQMGTGMLFFVPLWMTGVRDMPFHSLTDFANITSKLGTVSLFSTLSHAAGVISLGLGSVSFVQVVKAAEPLFTALISISCFREYLSLAAYLSMIPVILGVIIASVSELHFSWPCFAAGVLSNLFAGARAVVSKRQMTTAGEGHSKRYNVEQLSAANFYSVITVISFMMCMPLMLFNESRQILELIRVASTTGLTSIQKQGLIDAVLSGMMYYLYNEMSFKVLANMNPVSHALANTVKRVAVIALSVFVFKTKITKNGKLGSVIAILGAMVYSLVGKKSGNVAHSVDRGEVPNVKEI